MSTPAARKIKGGAHAAVRHDSAVGHVTGRAVYPETVDRAFNLARGTNQKKE